jgi:Holliday junction resolvase RusA-like endonuclease
MASRRRNTGDGRDGGDEPSALEPRQFEAIEFFVRGVPVPQPRHQISGYRRYIKKRKDGRPHPIFAWKSSVQNIALRYAPGEPLTGPVGVGLTFFLPLPAKHKKLAMIASCFWATGNSHDRDNLDKAVLDAMTDISFWADDGQVCDGAPTKVFVSDRAKCGVRVRVFPLGDPPTP